MRQPPAPPAPPAAPAPPAPPAPPGASLPEGATTISIGPSGVQVGRVGADGAVDLDAAPTTREGLATLRARRSELSNQLNSAQERRDELAEQLRSGNVSGADRAGIEARLKVLDSRILGLEQEIANTGRLMAQAPALGSTGRGTPFPGGPSRGRDLNVTAISVIFTIFVLAPIAVAIARGIWKRGVRIVPPAPSPMDQARFDRLEQAVEAIAVEVERIGEGQRFVTQLLAQNAGRERAALGAPARGADDPAGVR